MHVDSAGWGKTQSMLALADLPEVEEIHAVTGDTCLILKVRTQDTQALEELLAQIYAVEGVRGTRSYVVLSSHVERGPRPLLPRAAGRPAQAMKSLAGERVCRCGARRSRW